MTKTIAFYLVNFNSTLQKYDDLKEYFYADYFLSEKKIRGSRVEHSSFL